MPKFEQSAKNFSSNFLVIWYFINDIDDTGDLEHAGNALYIVTHALILASSVA